ncbi:MAG: amidohydrolase family protein, partial [Phycisphaeraceae bacterium]
MIVDVHTRIWDSLDQLGSAAERLRQRRSQPWNRATASADEHQHAMQPVAAAFVLGLQSELIGAAIDNATIAAYVRRQPDRLVGFAGVDPMAPRPVAQLEQAREAGLAGLVLSPAAQGFHPTDSRAMRLYEAAEHHRMPVIFEAGPLAREAKMEFGQPALLDEVARSFPNLRIVLGSMGYPWVEQGLALVGKHPTVYTELGELIGQPWSLYNALLLAHQQQVINQIFFGSNFPFHSPERAIITVYSVNTLVQGTHLPSVPREQLRSIVERDALAALGLKLPPRTDEPTQIAAHAQAVAVAESARTDEAEDDN